MLIYNIVFIYFRLFSRCEFCKWLNLLRITYSIFLCPPFEKFIFFMGWEVQLEDFLKRKNFIFRWHN